MQTSAGIKYVVHGNPEKAMKIHEFVYGLFDYFDYTFFEGSYPIEVGGKNYDLFCHKVVRLSERAFFLFEDLPEFYKKIEAECKPFTNSLPIEGNLLLFHEFFEEQVKKCSSKKDSIRDKVECLAIPATCLMIQINHFVDGDPMDFITSLRDDNGIEDSKQVFLSVVREFHNYHIVMRSPHIYVTDIHCRSSDGMFSFFCSDDMSPITKVRPILSYWEPKLEENAQDKAIEHFRNAESIHIEDLAMARARVHAERQHHTLAIINAVMALEVVVPDFINRFLKHNGVSKTVINDFNHKFGLSVRVKAILKVILPREAHGTIDNAGVAITHRNKILHEGLQDSSLSATEVDQLVQACDELIGNIVAYSKKETF